jgi:uncharacterized membrane protein YkoI
MAGNETNQEVFMNSRTALLSCVAFAALFSSSAMAYSGQQYAHEARITLAQARTIAAKARPGRITDQELEREAGGSGLRYSFDVKSGNRTFEVGIDARTGKVLENSPEGANPD